MITKSDSVLSRTGNLFFLIVLIFTLSFNNAKSSDSLKVKSSIGNDFSADCKAFWQDGVSYFTLPFRLSGKEWLYTAAGSAATVGLMTIDEDVKEAASVQNGNSQTGIWAVARSYGEVKYWGPVSLLTYSTGLFFRNKEIRVVGRMLIQSIIYSGIVTTAIKFITGRSRPSITNNEFQFNWFETSNDYVSFPSGHATIAFAMSTVIAERINKWWARIGLYSFASLAAYSRIHDTQHWLSDVVVGSVIGFGTGFFVVHKENEREKKHANVLSKMNFYPSLRGVNLVYKF